MRIWKRKGDIPMAKIYGEVIVNHPNRFQLKFEDCFSTVVYLFKSILTQKVFILEIQQGAQIEIFLSVKH